MIGAVCVLKTSNLFLIVASLSSILPLVFPLSSNLLVISSSLHLKYSTPLRSTRFLRILSQASIFYWPRGNPSKRYLPPKLCPSSFYSISPTNNSLDTNFPSFMYSSISNPILFPFFTASLSKSPVDRCLKPYSLTRISHCLSKKYSTFLSRILGLLRRIEFLLDLECQRLLNKAFNLFFYKTPPSIIQHELKYNFQLL